MARKEVERRDSSRQLWGKASSSILTGVRLGGHASAPQLGATAEDLTQQAAKQKVYDQLRSEPGTDEQLLNRTVNELNLSVRARKALALLNIHTIGDLCLKTDAELMGVKNFGSTSLNEIRRQLEQLGLSLRKLEQ